MTQISGQIYQLTNGKTGAELVNRFPRTVIEAVYGLSSYLQTQFSALADIYMPIEGITESKTGQEFVYRKSPATIKAKSLTLDRIYGKTLAWNQLVNSLYLSSGTYSGLTLTNNSDLSYTINGTVEGEYFDQRIVDGLTIIAGHKYIVSIDIPSVEVNFGQVTSSTTDGAGFALNTPQANNDKLYLTIFSGTFSNKRFYPQVFDLTLLYGSEIDGMTDAQILEKFESEFPGYHDFGNKLISNDAESLETVGFNLWDEEWENGYYNATGGKTMASNQICSKNLFPVLTGATYYYKCSNAAGGNFAFYDANKNFVVRTDSAASFTIPTGCCYMGISVGADYGSTYLHDICINISDPAKNGTYEPYRKSTLQLGLNNFKVKSHNIWDEEWELGTYSGTDGSKAIASNAIRCKNLIPVFPGTQYYAHSGFESGTGRVCYYDANKNFISTAIGIWGGIITTPSNAKYLTFNTTTSYGATYNNDICINLSSSFNGQYEPHGDITITGGLKSAGSVKDEIVGNKYIKRVGSVDLGTLEWEYYTADNTLFYAKGSQVDNLNARIGTTTNAVCSRYIKTNTNYAQMSNGQFRFDTSMWSTLAIYIFDSRYTDAATFKTAMSGVMLYYELATPIEYELVEPLVYSMAAGTTEARISPNADGLSAPFCCDMTYDANANNDSANAQYALTAGRLYNTHKLWGQDFDGSNDVSGALSGVTTIGASGNITTAAQLISTVATGTAPLSVESTTEVANLHSYTATKLHTQRTLWGRDFDGSGNVTGDMSNVGNIAFSASGKNIASLLYFDTTNSRVGVGASSPAYKLDVSGTFRATGDTTIGGAFTVGTSESNKATTLNGTLSVTSTSTLTGRVGIGAAPDSSAILKVTGAALFTSTISATGGITSQSYITAGAAASSSDARLKDNIKEVVDGMSVISRLTPREWIWNEKNFYLSGKRGAGLIAQEVAKVLPFSVVDEGDFLALNYNVLHAYEISALQSHEERIKALEKENRELKKKLNLN